MLNIRSPLDGFRSPFGRKAGAGNDGGAGPEKHRYWMINITANNGDAVTSISELELYEAAYGVNVAPQGVVTAKNSYGGGFEVSKLTDGILMRDDGTPGNRWMSSTDGPPWWIKIDFGDSPKGIAAIGIHFRDGGSASHALKDFEILHSDDDSEYETAWAVEGETNWQDREFRRFINPDFNPPYSGSPFGEHAFWELYIQSDSSGGWTGLAEVEFLDAPGGTDQASGGTASSSGNYGGWEADKAFDNNNATNWTPADTWGRLGYAFLSPVAVGAISIRARGDGEPEQAAKQACVRFSDDGSAFTTAWQVSGQTGWSLGEKRTFTDPAYI